MSGIIWLASYPKSGNTWFSIFVANLLADGAAPVDISRPFGPANFAAREHFDRLTGWESSELSGEQVARLRFGAQAALARESPLAINKTHEAFSDPIDGRPLFSAKATRCALLLVRNPLDIVASLSHHAGMSLDETIRFMGASRAIAFPGRNRSQLPQVLLDWSSHARSWVEAAGVAVQVIRYEDLLERPEETFGHACQFAQLPAERSRVIRAIERSGFEALQNQERSKGFPEAQGGRRFFREGRGGTWSQVLSAEQVAAVVGRHGAMMRRFGYLDEGGRPIPDSRANTLS